MPLRRLLPTALLAAALMTPPALGHADILSGIGGYFRDRFHDTLDVVRLRVGWARDGKGLGVKARATSALQAGFVTFDGTYAGLDRRGFGIVDERRREAGVSFLYGSFNEMEPVLGNHFLRADTDWSIIEDRRILRNLPHWDDGRQRHLSFGAEVATPLIAIDAGVYPEEALDLVLGFFLIDLFNDDELFSHRKELRFREATTLPEPNPDAPFADIQEQHNALILELERQAAEKALEEEAAAGGAPIGQLPPVDRDAGGGLISSDAADELMRELDDPASAESPVPPPQDTEPGAAP